MSYFLAKSEPGTYSIADLERDETTVWDGVTNPQAVRAIRAMKPGDTVFIYHSGKETAVVGVARVAGEPRTDPKNAKSAVVEFKYAGRVAPPATLAEIKQSGRFRNWALVRQSRLSTMEAPEDFARWLENTGRTIG